MTDADSFTIPLLVADLGFWTLVADFGFWTLVADVEFWTLVADVEFWTLVADLDFGHSWPIISFRPQIGLAMTDADSFTIPLLVADLGFWTLVASWILDNRGRF